MHSCRGKILPRRSNLGCAVTNIENEIVLYVSVCMPNHIWLIACIILSIDSFRLTSVAAGRIAK